MRRWGSCAIPASVVAHPDTHTHPLLIPLLHPPPSKELSSGVRLWQGRGLPLCCQGQGGRRDRFQAPLRPLRCPRRRAFSVHPLPRPARAPGLPQHEFSGAGRGEFSGRITRREPLLMHSWPRGLTPTYLLTTSRPHNLTRASGPRDLATPQQHDLTTSPTHPLRCGTRTS